MSEMVERVGKAISDAAGNDWNEANHALWFRMLARAAIAAMRQPTEAMLEAAMNLELVSKGAVIPPAPKEAWQAMIDAALVDPQK